MCNLSMMDFCRKYNLPVSTISKLENGRLDITGINMFKKYAKVMKIPFSDFMSMYEIFENTDKSIVDLVIYNTLSEYYLKKNNKK